MVYEKDGQDNQLILLWISREWWKFLWSACLNDVWICLTDECLLQLVYSCVCSDWKGRRQTDTTQLGQKVSRQTDMQSFTYFWLPVLHQNFCVWRKHF